MFRPIIFLLIVFSLPSPKSIAGQSLKFGSKPNSEECATFLSDFRQMKEAQVSIQQSLISNHEVMAESLDTYADALKETSGKAYKKITENMYKASESIRKRKTKAQSISKEFDEKSLEILKTAEKCVIK